VLRPASLCDAFNAGHTKASFSMTKGLHRVPNVPSTGSSNAADDSHHSYVALHIG
jgi:hypothetical protein